mgnify:CR=1 FL=1
MGTRNAEERRKAAGKHRKESFSVKLEVVARYEPQANKKFFDPTIFQKCWRGVGEQPTFAKQITKLHNEMQQKSKRESKESQLP